MTYDPGRDPQNPLDVNPKPREYRDETPKAGMGAGLWLGILAALAIATFVMFSMGRNDNVAVINDRPVTNAPSTTGAGATDPAPEIRDRATGGNPPNQNAPRPAPRP